MIYHQEIRLILLMLQLLWPIQVSSRTWGEGKWFLGYLLFLYIFLNDLFYF